MEGGERVTLSNSFGWKKSVNTFSILVVDDDTTCLSIVAAILKKFKYEVVTVKHPNDALYTLRIKGGAFDLVVSDVHMPDMNGFELQQAIAQEFNLPVVLMSADDKEGVALKGLESGAAYFILKPVSSDDLRDLWQFAAMKKKSQVVIEEKTGSFPQGKTTNVSDEIVVSATSVNEDTANKKDSKGKSPRKEGSSDEKIGENSQSASQKRPKLVWTNSLHNRFLEAIRSIGLDRAVPKKILEVMNVPGLTRENVASHLQKYRIFLRRVSDASYKIQYSTDKGLSQNLKSSSESSGITSPSSTLKLNKFNKLNYQNSEKFPVDAHNAALPNVEPSSSSLITQSGFGQSRLLSNRGSWLKPNIGNTNLMIHQNDRSYARLAQKNYQTRPPIQGHLANVSLEDLSSALSAGFDTFPSYDVPSQKNVGTSDIISSSPSEIFTYQTNYVGYSISSIKQLTTPGHSEKYDGSKSCAGMINLPSDEVQNNSTLQAALTIPHDNNILDRLAQPVGASNSIAADNNGGEQLSDVIGDYTMLLSSNLPFVSCAENGGKINEFAFSPIFDMSEFDMLSTQHLEESVFGTTLVDQVNFQTQAQQTGGDTTTNSNFDGNVSHWVNHIPSFDRAPNQQQVYQGLTNSLEFGTSSQLSKTLLLHTERDDDDFLESLLAPFVEDQTLEGI